MNLGGRKKLTCMTFLYVLAPRNNTEAHTFFSIVRICKWSTLSRKIVEIKKFWYQCNVILCLCSQMQSLVLRYARKQNKKCFFSNLSKFISIVELALDRVFKGLCFRRRQFKHDQLKINMKSIYSKTDA